MNGAINECCGGNLVSQGNGSWLKCSVCKQPCEGVEASSVYPCNVCDAPAIACLRPDPDIKGLCFCEAHRDEVYTVYMMLLSEGGEEMAKPIIAKWRRK